MKEIDCRFGGSLFLVKKEMPVYCSRVKRYTVKIVQVYMINCSIFLAFYKCYNENGYKKGDRR